MNNNVSKYCKRVGKSNGTLQFKVKYGYYLLPMLYWISQQKSESTVYQEFTMEHARVLEGG